MSIFGDYLLHQIEATAANHYFIIVNQLKVTCIMNYAIGAEIRDGLISWMWFRFRHAWQYRIELNGMRVKLEGLYASKCIWMLSATEMSDLDCNIIQLEKVKSRERLDAFFQRQHSHVFRCHNKEPLSVSCETIRFPFSILVLPKKAQT